MRYKFYFVKRSIDMYKAELKIININKIFILIRFTRKTETPSNPEASPILKI